MTGTFGDPAGAHPTEDRELSTIVWLRENLAGTQWDRATLADVLRLGEPTPARPGGPSPATRPGS